jgi:uncharacterized protein YuzE
MRADYDSQADALSIIVRDFDRFEHEEQIDDDYCNVGLSGGVPVHVELIAPRDHLDLLRIVSKRYDLDATALTAAAQAALAAPDRVITMDVAARMAV